MSWSEDGSGHLTLDGAQVRYTGAGGSKANAIWSNGGTGFWEFKVSGNSGTWIGVAPKDKFAPGYGLKGLLFGGPGNLSDGSSLVIGHWGPSFGDGDVIGMRLEQSGDRTVLAYSKNGAGLGFAFDITGWSGEMQPVVSMDGSGQGVTITEGSVPSLDTFLVSGSPGAGVEGDWEGRFKLQVEKTGDKTYRVSAKVGNSMSCTVTEENGTFVSGPVMATKMMPPPHLQQLEQEVSNILEGLTGLRRDGENLILEAGGTQEICKPGAGTGPASKEKIHWMN